MTNTTLTCVACGEPLKDHIGNTPSPPRIKGHLGATESRPGACLTTRGKVPHRKHADSDGDVA